MSPAVRRVILTFGTTYCLIEVEQSDEKDCDYLTFRAFPYVMTGQSNERVYGPDGADVEFLAGSGADAVVRACLYLQGRFGEMAPAPVAR